MAPHHPDQAGRRESNWSTRLAGVQEFVREHDRLPRRHRPDTASERTLGFWLDYQRRTLDHLTDTQVIALNRLPGFDWAPRELAWTRQARAYLNFVTVTGRRPRRNSTNPSETQLASWHARQRRLDTRRQLPFDRRQEYRELEYRVRTARGKPIADPGVDAH